MSLAAHAKLAPYANQSFEAPYVFDPIPEFQTVQNRVPGSKGSFQVPYAPAGSGPAEFQPLPPHLLGGRYQAASVYAPVPELQPPGQGVNADAASEFSRKYAPGMAGAVAPQYLNPDAASEFSRKYAPGMGGSGEPDYLAEGPSPAWPIIPTHGGIPIIHTHGGIHHEYPIIHTHGGIQRDPCVAPDGQRIPGCNGGGLPIIHTHGGIQRDPCVAPDGQRIPGCNGGGLPIIHTHGGIHNEYPIIPTHGGIQHIHHHHHGVRSQCDQGADIYTYPARRLFGSVDYALSKF